MKKILKSLSIIMLIFITACTGLVSKEVRPTEKAEIVIMHSNDSHGRIVEGSNDGMGYARINTLVKDAKATNANVIYLDAGDTLHGTVMASLDKGESMVKVLNASGVAAIVPGNHDFNYGIDRLIELSKKMNFPVLANNVAWEKDGKLIFEEYKISTVAGYRIGVFGVATPETLFKTSPNNVVGVKFIDPVTASKNTVEKLKKEKVDFIVALSHLGLDESSDEKNRSDNLARLVPEINLIVDGHSHTVLKEGKKVGNTMIVQTGDYNKNLGKVKLTLNPDGTNLVEASLLDKATAMKDVKEDEEMVKLVAEVKASQASITEVVLGSTEVKLIGDRAVVRKGESNLGNYLTDAMKWKTGADIAITNGGGIRASINAGTIKKADVLSVLPFGNYVIVIEATGADIKAALENGTAGYPSEHGAFSHVSGIKYSFDPTKLPGQRVQSVMIGDKALDLNKVYKIATNDFMAAGGDKYDSFKGKKQVAHYEGLDEILADYIKSGAKAKEGIEGRITVSK